MGNLYIKSELLHFPSQHLRDKLCLCIKLVFYKDDIYHRSTFFILQSLKSELELSNEFEIVIVAELLFLNFDVVMQNIVLAAWKLNDIN